MVHKKKGIYPQGVIKGMQACSCEINFACIGL